jgi:hypothetical protein
MRNRKKIRIARARSGLAIAASAAVHMPEEITEAPPCLG